MIKTMNALQKYIGRTNTKTVREQIIQTILSMDQPVNKDAVQFDQSPSDPTALIPANLYTLLLTRGILAPYEQVKNKTEYKVPENTPYYGGAIIQFIKGSDAYTLIPVKPIRKLMGEIHPEKEPVNGKHIRLRCNPPP